ncbi:MAG: hypothetical protein RI897_84 [Verrucomicrobiota bacterium]
MRPPGALPRAEVALLQVSLFHFPFKDAARPSTLQLNLQPKPGRLARLEINPMEAVHPRAVCRRCHDG